MTQQIVYGCIEILILCENPTGASIQLMPKQIHESSHSQALDSFVAYFSIDWLVDNLFWNG